MGKSYKFDISNIKDRNTVLYDLLLIPSSQLAQTNKEAYGKMLEIGHNTGTYEMKLYINDIEVDIKEWVDRYEKHFDHCVGERVKEVIQQKIDNTMGLILDNLDEISKLIKVKTNTLLLNKD